MSARKRIIPADQVEVSTPWVLPEVQGRQGHSSAIRREEVPEPPTAEELEAIREAARREGAEAGYRAGKEQARQQHQTLAQQWHTLMQAMTRPLEPMDEALENQILLLVTRLVRHIVHREMQTRPDEIIPVIREALAALPENSRNIRVLLHPEDARLAEEILGDTRGDRWVIQSEPGLKRGDCLIKAEDAQVDARLDKRLDQLITAFLGDRRTALDEPEDPHDQPA